MLVYIYNVVFSFLLLAHMLLPTFLYTLAFLIDMVMVCFQERHPGGREGRGGQRGAPLLIPVDGQVGGPFFQQVHTPFRG